MPEVEPIDINLLQGIFPHQCQSCGRELINMGCRTCPPPTPPIVRNRGGFSKYGHISRPPLPVPAPCLDDHPPKRVVRFNGFGPTGESFNELWINNKRERINQQKPFWKPFKQTTIEVLTVFRFYDHEWTTLAVPCHSDTTEVTLFRALRIHYLQIINETGGCRNFEGCLCNLPGIWAMKTQADIVGYKLFLLRGRYTLEVELRFVRKT